MPIRLSGLASGLDTEAIVGALVSAYSYKKDKYVKIEHGHPKNKGLCSIVFYLRRFFSNCLPERALHPQNLHEKHLFEAKNRLEISEQMHKGDKIAQKDRFFSRLCAIKLVIAHRSS